MKLKGKYNSFLIITVSCLILAACSKMDEYKNFGNGKEVTYSGKTDSVIPYAGKNRIKISWLRSADPKIVKTRIYWNNRTDSVDIPQTNTLPAEKRLSTIINNLPEGSYNFELFNYDSQGNRSVATKVSGSVYGEVFQKSLTNRILESFYEKQFNIGYHSGITWFGSVDKSVGVEITYKDKSGNNRRVVGDAASKFTLIGNYDVSMPIAYRTMFLPEPTAIDTFYAVAASKAADAFPANQIHIRNPGEQFIAEKTVGRWGTPADWTVTTPVKNHDGGVGGLDNLNRTDRNRMSFEYWGTPQIVNGKIYQTGTLPAGTYRLVVSTENVNNNLEASYLSVAKGNELPNVEDINSSVVNLKLISGMSNRDLTLSFTLTQPELLSFGVVSTMKLVNESSLRLKQFKLFKD